jgi:hypothetical protein
MVSRCQTKAQIRAWSTRLRHGWLPVEEEIPRTETVDQAPEFNVDRIYDNWFAWGEKHRDDLDQEMWHVRSFSSSSLPSPY